MKHQKGKTKKSACSSTFFLMAGEYTTVAFHFSPLHCNSTTVSRCRAVLAGTKVQAPTHTICMCTPLHFNHDAWTLLPLLFHHTNYTSQ
jgi:hypothetical protein